MRVVIGVYKLKLTVYFLSKFFGLFSAARFFSKHKIRILCYHGGSIGDECQFNGKLFITKKTFSKRLKWLLGSGYTIISLDEAVASLIDQKPPQPLSTVLTFDDGWYSTGKDLLPLLAINKLPSTLYLSTEYFESGLPIVDVTINYIAWKVGRKEFYISGFDEAIDGFYNLEIIDSYNSFILKVGLVLDKLKNRDLVLEKLNDLALAMGLAADQLDLISRRFDFLNKSELLDVAKSGCSIELHGHVHDYPIGKPEQFRNDLILCSDIIRKIGLPEPKHYCYPSGGYDSGASSVLQMLGIDSATTCISGLIGSIEGDDRYYISRFLDGESIHVLEFEAEMSGFSDFLRRMLSWLNKNK